MLIDQFEILREGFRYDLWANLRWLECIGAKGEADRKIFQHIFAAQEVWLQRTGGVSLTSMPVFEPTEAKIRVLHEGWLKVFSENEDDPVYHFRSTTGIPGSQSLSRIARHVINHGTYHRGELRGLCFAREDAEFPETDLIGFYMETGMTE